MNFVLQMAWRDSRAARRRLLLCSLSIVLGVAALVGIGSFSDNLRRGVAQQTKALLGADLAVTSRRPFPPETEAWFAALGGEQARETIFNSVASFPTGGGRQRLVQVHALEGGFPFYGDLETQPAGAMDRLRAGNFAVLDETLLAQFGVRPGDEVRLGRSTFVVAGALKKIPGESAAIAMFSPRIYIPRGAVGATGLLGPGGFVRHKVYFKLPASSDPEILARAVKEKFGAQRLSVDTVESRKRDLGQTLDDVASFLGLVGFIALFLGAVGVASAINVHIRQKLATVAVLRCLGATARTSFSIYLVQGFCLGVVGALVGAALGIAVQVLLPTLARDFLPFPVDLVVSWPAVARGAGAGLIICVLFSLLPLLAVRRVSPLLALRSGYGEDADGRDPWRLALYGVIGAAVVGFALLQSDRWKVGLGFALGLGVSFGVLAGVARLVAYLARRFSPKNAPYVWRQGLANLYRPNNRTVLLLISLGLGTFLMLTLVLTRATLLDKMLGLGRGGRPNLMFFDIQDDQLEPMLETMRQAGVPATQQAPVVTMRLTSLKGRSVEEILKDPESHIPAWTLRREYRSSYRATLGDTEHLVAGVFSGQAEPGADRVPVSLEEGIARDLQLKLGDDLVFDVQGVPIKAVVGSLRQVEWQRLQPNFFVVFPAGVLEAAPKFYLVATHAAAPADSARVQRAVTEKFPNVSSIDLAQVLQTIDGIVAKVAAVISFMAMFTVATGLVVLVGAVLAGRYQRIRESVLLRTLGAERRQIARILLLEYAILGTLAAATGILLAVAANGLLAHYVFHTEWSWHGLILAGAWLAVSAVTVLTGRLASRGIYDQPPLEVLRQET